MLLDICATCGKQEKKHWFWANIKPTSKLLGRSALWLWCPLFSLSFDGLVDVFTCLAQSKSRKHSKQTRDREGEKAVERGKLRQVRRESPGTILRDFRLEPEPEADRSLLRGTALCKVRETIILIICLQSTRINSISGVNTRRSE